MKKINNIFFSLKNKISYLIIGTLFLGTMTISSCKFLELDPIDGVSEANVFTTPDGFQSARIGMYAALGNENYYGGTFPLALEAHSDNGSNGGYAVAAYNELGTLKAVTPNNIVVEKMWLAMYSPINIANQILANIDNIRDSSFIKGKKDNIKAEALFVRALCHFDALRTWGEHWDNTSALGIPVVTTPQTFDKVVARSSVSDTYKAIVTDLLAAQTLIKGTDKTFVNVTAVNALLARVYLYSKNNSEAATLAEQIIKDAGTSPFFGAADYDKIFTTKQSKESIFELAFTTQSRSVFNQLSYVRPEAIRSEVVFLASADLNDFFKKRTNDVRARLVNFTDVDPSISPDGRSEKYRGEQTRDNPAYVLRLAEQFLIAAEAVGKTKGIVYLNAIRGSRGMSILPGAITEAVYAKAIADERRAELNMEGHRYFDLARTGQVQDVMGKDVKSNLPIPTREITATNGGLLQNKGY